MSVCVLWLPGEVWRGEVKWSDGGVHRRGEARRGGYSTGERGEMSGQRIPHQRRAPQWRRRRLRPHRLLYKRDKPPDLISKVPNTRKSAFYSYFTSSKLLRVTRTNTRFGIAKPRSSEYIDIEYRVSGLLTERQYSRSITDDKRRICLRSIDTADRCGEIK